MGRRKLWIFLGSLLLVACQNSEPPKSSEPAPPPSQVSHHSVDSETEFKDETVPKRELKHPKTGATPGVPLKFIDRSKKRAPKKTSPPPKPRAVTKTPPKPAKRAPKVAKTSESPYPTSKPKSSKKKDNRGKNASADPYFHPSIKLLERAEYPWLDVKFEVKANGKFEVEVLTQIDDLDLQHVTLLTLNRWKWKPKIVDGVPVDSTEVLRLRAKHH